MLYGIYISLEAIETLSPVSTALSQNKKVFCLSNFCKQFINRKQEIKFSLKVKKYATIAFMTLLPKNISPKYEFHDMKTRNEILAEWKCEKCNSEKAYEKKLLNNIKSKNLGQCKVVNGKLSEKVSV